MPLPGGKGPQSPLKFVLPNSLFADATGGHILWPLTQVRIQRSEPQPKLSDHYSRLFFGRNSATQAGQPFFLWQQSLRIDDPEVISWRADHTLLHRYRTGFQTVGQPWQTWAKYKQPDFEPEQIRPVVSNLYAFRQFTPTQTAGQPWWMWQSVKIEPIAETIQQPDQTALHRFRTTYQTVGQPYSIWAKYKQPEFEPERFVSPQYELAPYRQITITASPGQPWYLWPWPPVQVTIQPEEQMWRTDHANALYPFLPHPAPSVTIIDVAAPIGHPVPREIFQWKVKGETPQDQFRRIIDSVGKKATPEPIRAKTEGSVLSPEPSVVPRVAAVTEKLIAKQELEAILLDDEEILIIIMLDGMM